MPRKQDEELERRKDIERINSSTTFYQALGVSQSAKPEEIRIAYRRIEARLNPSNNPGAEAEVKGPYREAKIAYDFLSDPKKRKKYDNDLAPKQSLTEKLENALKSFCRSVSNFVDKYRNQQEHKPNAPRS